MCLFRVCNSTPAFNDFPGKAKTQLTAKATAKLFISQRITMSTGTGELMSMMTVVLLNGLKSVTLHVLPLAPLIEYPHFARDPINLSITTKAQIVWR